MRFQVNFGFNLRFHQCLCTLLRWMLLPGHSTQHIQAPIYLTIPENCPVFYHQFIFSILALPHKLDYLAFYSYCSVVNLQWELNTNCMALLVMPLSCYFVPYNCALMLKYSIILIPVVCLPASSCLAPSFS